MPVPEPAPKPYDQSTISHAKGEILYETEHQPLLLATPEPVSNVKQPYKLDNKDDEASPPPASDYLDQK